MPQAKLVGDVVDWVFCAVCAVKFVLCH